MSATISHEGGTLSPTLIDGYQASRDVRNIVHGILNRTNPDVTLRAPGARTGTMRLLFPEQADAVGAYAAMSVPQVFTLNDLDVPAVGMSFVVGPEGSQLAIELDDETRSVWWIVVPFVEVSP